MTNEQARALLQIPEIRCITERVLRELIAIFKEVDTDMDGER